MAQSNDQTLLQQYAADGSQDAFAQLVDRHIDLVHTAARRMVHGDSHLAEDVTQAVFILLARRAGQIKPNVVLAGWLYNATRLSASVALRGQRRRQRHETAAASEALRMRSSNSSQRAGDSPAPSWDQLETVIDDAMGKLSTADRDAIALRFFQNKTMAEAGAAMGITEDAAKMRVTRAVTRLRNTLARAGVTAAPVPALMVVMSAAVPNAAPAGLAQATMAAALAAIGTAAGKAGGSYAIAKGTSAMMTWIKIKLTLATAAVVMAVVGTGAAVVAQTLLKAHEAPSPAVQVVAATPSTPAIPIATPAGAEATAPPAPLTLNLDGVDPRTAIAMIAKISGTKIDIWPDTAWNPQFMGFGKAMPKVTLHADNQPFWSVLRDFCQQAGARVQEMGNRANTVTIAADDNGSFSRLPAFVGPTHMVVLNSISRSNSVRFDQDRSIHEDRGGSFDVWIDPRVNVLKASHGVWIESAVDENGKSLVVPHDPAWDEFYMGGFSPWHLSLNFPLNYDWTQSKTLKRLTGHARIIVPSKTATIEFPDLLNAKGAEKSAGGVRLVVNDVQVSPNQLEYRATLYRGSGLSKDQWRDRCDQARAGILVIDANGTRLSEGGGGGGDDRRIDVGSNMSFSANTARPVKLVWQIATESQAVDLPFEFHDLPLP